MYVCILYVFMIKCHRVILSKIDLKKNPLYFGFWVFWKSILYCVHTI